MVGNLYKVYNDSRKPLVAPRPQDPRTGVLESFSAGFFEGLNKELTTTMANTAWYWAMGREGNEIDQDQFNGIVGKYGAWLDYKEGMTSKQAEFLRFLKSNEQRNMVALAGARGFWAKGAGIGGMFAGTFADPINLGSLAIPVLRAETALAPMAKYSPMIKNLMEKSDSILGSAKLGAAIGFTEAAIREPFILAGQKKIQGEYDWVDSLTNLVVAPGFGGLFGGALGALRKWGESSFHAAMDAPEAYNLRFTEMLEEPKLMDYRAELDYFADKMRRSAGERTPPANPNRVSLVEQMQGVARRRTPGPYSHTSKPFGKVPGDDFYELRIDLKRGDKVIHEKGSHVSARTLREFGYDPRPPSRVPTDAEVAKEAKARKRATFKHDRKTYILNTEKPINRWTNQDWINAAGKKRSELTDAEIARVKRALTFNQIELKKEMIERQQDLDIEAEKIKGIRPMDEATPEEIEADIRLNGVRSIFYNQRKYRVKGESADAFKQRLEDLSYVERRQRELIEEMEAAERAVAENPIMRARRRALLRIKEDAYNKNSSAAKTLAERAVSKLFKQTFGRDVRFFDARAAETVFEARGLVTNKDFKTLYVQKDSMTNMLFVAGHEMAHSVKYQNPELYRKLVNIIGEWDNLNDGKIVDAALRDVYNRQGDLRGVIFDDQIIEEAFNNVFGYALSQPSFWRHMKKQNRTLFEKIWDWLAELQQKLHYIVGGMKSESELPGRLNIPEEFRNLNEMNKQLARTLSIIERQVGPKERSMISSLEHNKQYLGNLFRKYSKGPAMSRYKRWFDMINENAAEIERSNSFETWEVQGIMSRVGTMEKTYKGKTTNPAKRALKHAARELELDPKAMEALDASILKLDAIGVAKAAAYEQLEEAIAITKKLKKEIDKMPLANEVKGVEAKRVAEANHREALVRYYEAIALRKLKGDTYDAKVKEYNAYVHKILPESPIVWRTNPKNADEWEFFFIGESKGSRTVDTSDGGDFPNRTKQAEEELKSKTKPSPTDKVDTFEGEEFWTPQQLALANLEKIHKQKLSKRMREKGGTKMQSEEMPFDHVETLLDWQVARWLNDILEESEGRKKGPWNPLDDEMVKKATKAENLVTYMKDHFDVDIDVARATEMIEDAFLSMHARYDVRPGGLDMIERLTYDSSRHMNPDHLNDIKLQRGFDHPIYYRGDYMDPNSPMHRALEEDVFDVLNPDEAIDHVNRLMDENEDFISDKMRFRPQMPKENPLKKIWDRLKLRETASNLDLSRVKERVRRIAAWQQSNTTNGKYTPNTLRRAMLSQFSDREKLMIEQVAFGKMTIEEVEARLSGPEAEHISAEAMRIANVIARWRKTQLNHIRELEGLLRELKVDGMEHINNAAIAAAMKKLTGWAAMSEFRQRSMYQSYIREWSRYTDTTDMPSADGFGAYLKNEVNRKATIELGVMAREEALIKDWKQKKAELGKDFGLWLTSYFDGVWKKGLSTKHTPFSFDMKKHTQVTKDTALWMQTAQKHNLTDELNRPDSDLFKRIIDYYESRDPSILEGEHGPAIRDLVEALELTTRAQVGAMNNAGVDVHYNPKFWHSQKHSRSLIVKNKKKWVRWMLENVDWERVHKATGREHGARNRQGDIDYLEQVYFDIENNRMRDMHADDPEILRNMSNEVIQSRTIHFKDGMSYEYDKLFGSGDPYRSFLEGLQRRAELTAIFSEFGPNPELMWRNLMEATNTNDKVGGIATPKALFDYAIGKMDDPVDGKWAERRSVLMQFANAAYLGFSAVSGVVDIAHMIGSMRHLGIDLGKMDKEMWKILRRSQKRQGNADLTTYYRYLGAGADVVLNSASRRTTGDTPAGTLGRKMNNFIFAANGLNYWTVIAQEAVVDTLTRVMGEADFVKKHPKFMDVLSERYGISPEEFTEAHGYRAKIDDYNRLSPDMFELENPQLANKFRNFLEDWIRQGVIEPDATSQVWVRLGLQDGTPLGSMIRVMTQYMSFGMATYRKTYMRMLNAYGEQGFAAIMKDPTKRRQMDMLAFMGWSLALGYIGMNMKELARGREPVHLGNINRQTAKRWVFQSGIAGPLSDLMWARDMEGIADIALGPALGGIMDVGDEVLDGDIRGSIYRLERNAPGATLPGVGEIRKRILAPITGDAYIEGQKAIENLFDQKVFLFNPDEE